MTDFDDREYVIPGLDVGEEMGRMDRTHTSTVENIEIVDREKRSSRCNIERNECVAAVKLQIAIESQMVIVGKGKSSVQGQLELSYKLSCSLEDFWRSTGSDDTPQQDGIKEQ